MSKSHFNDESLVLLGPIISRLFTCSNVEKNKLKKTNGACSSPISMNEYRSHPWANFTLTSLKSFQISTFINVSNLAGLG